MSPRQSWDEAEFLRGGAFEMLSRPGQILGDAMSFQEDDAQRGFRFDNSAFRRALQPIDGLRRIGVQFRRTRQQVAGHIRRGGRVARAALPDFCEVVGGASQRDAAQPKLRLRMAPRRGAPIPGRRLDRIPATPRPFS